MQMPGDADAVLIVVDTPAGLQDGLPRVPMMAELLFIGDPRQHELPVGGNPVLGPGPRAPQLPADDTEGEHADNAHHQSFHDLTPELLFIFAA